MIRYFLTAAAVALLLAVPVEAKRVLVAYSPVQKLAHADTVVLGKVSAIEKDTIDALPHRGAKEKLAYKVAVIRVETGLVGAPNVTHVKVAFTPLPPGEQPEPTGGRGFGPVYLAEGQTGLFYLTKHHSGEFYVIDPLMRPTDTTDLNYKGRVEQAKRGAAAFADPMKALKADKAADRSFAAAVLVQKYRTYPENPEGVPVETVKVPAEESKLILKALAEDNWQNDPAAPDAPNGYQTFNMLGLTDKDGWKPPMVKPGEDYISKVRESFGAWLTGPGKDYQVNRFALKPGKQK